MTANYKGRIIETLKTSAKANIDKHIMNVDILIGSHTGVAEHPDMMETIEKELEIIAKYDDQLHVLRKYF